MKNKNRIKEGYKKMTGHIDEVINDKRPITIRKIHILEEDDEFTPEISPNMKYRKLPILLGSGSFKEVYKAIDETEGKEVAWNVLENRTYFLEEIKLLRSIRHQNIIEIYDYWIDGDKLIFITEMMTSGTLKDYIKNVKNMSINIVRKWSKQVLSGINYLHNLNPKIIHRDIKTENIFVNGALGLVKIGDLGIARNSDVKRYTIVGTPEYMAKEIFDGDGYTEKIDIYSFGMVLLEMASGIPPYSSLTSSTEIFRNVIKGILPESLELVKNESLRNLISVCLKAESERPSAKECLEHEFYNVESSLSELKIEEAVENAALHRSVISNFEIKFKLGPFNIYRAQLYFNDNMKYVTFKYDPKVDTPELIVNEMIREGLITDNVREEIEEIIGDSLGSTDGDNSNNILNISDINQLHPNFNFIGNANKPHAGGCSLCCNNNSAGVNIAYSPNINPNYAGSKEDLTNYIVCDDSFVNVNSPQVHRDNINMNHSNLSNLSLNYGSVNSEYGNNILERNIEDSPELEVSPIKEGELKVEFSDSFPIEDFLNETAIHFKRDKDILKEWLNKFKSSDIEIIGELKILVEEDWNRLNLTVFASRSIKNIIFGKNGPASEKDLVFNKFIREVNDDMKIRDFLEIFLGFKKEVILICEEKFSNQDIRTVEELKSLNDSDWMKLNLSVFTNRQIKNSLMRKGRVVIENKVVG